MKESLRYLENAKGLLKKSSVEDDTYLDVKSVREACGTAYLAVLKAIDEYLINKGLDRKELPKSVDGYRAAIKKYLATRDGKLTREFEALYDALHIAGYYRGLLRDVGLVKEAFRVAKRFIDKIGL